MQNNTHWPQVLAMTTAGLLLIWILAIIWLYRYDHQAQAILPTKMPNADVALILGNAVYKNNEPNLCLNSRVVAGAELYLNNKVPRLVMSGGNDTDGNNQAEAMRDMAIALGVPTDDILLEKKAGNTLENIQRGGLLIEADESVILVSAGFQLPRASVLAHQQWPNKKILSFSGQACNEPSTSLLWKLFKETLATAKIFVWDMAARP